MSSHSVRDMTVCDICQGMARKSTSILQGNKHFHGRCFIAQWGIDALLKLPTIDKECLTLSDIGSKAMRALIDAMPRHLRSQSDAATVGFIPPCAHRGADCNCPAGVCSQASGEVNAKD
jgi:hypothetical protein